MDVGDVGDFTFGVLTVVVIVVEFFLLDYRNILLLINIATNKKMLLI